MATHVARIYADFNGLVHGPVTGRTAVVLDTYGSLRDLSNAGIILKDGMELVTYDESDDEEDLEINGLVHYDAENQWWVVESDERGVIYVPVSQRIPCSESFHCVICGKELEGMDYSQLSRTCPGCATPARAAIAAPAN